MILVPTRVEGVPRFGVTNVGLVFITNVDPVPVWEAMEVVLPILVMGPERFALVVTVLALPVIDPVAVPMLGVVKVGEVV